MALKYIPNDLPLQTLDHEPLQLMKSSLEHILKTTPPQPAYLDPAQHGGFIRGPTSIAYLFFRLASLYPDVQVADHHLMHWAKRYVEADRGEPALTTRVGLSCEKLAYQALRACISADANDVKAFLSNIPTIVGPYSNGEKDPFESEIWQGRAGTLYFMRLMRHHLPDCAAILEDPIAQVSAKILADSVDREEGGWTFHKKKYIGAGHGDIGILTQLALTTPALAPELAPKLRALLRLQRDGNWPIAKEIDESRHPSLMQWCHGAPGVLYSLRAMRPYFADLRDEIDAAIARGQEAIWRQGLLRKEPSLCHGIFGNALNLPRGPHREHFLSLATIEAMEQAKIVDPDVFLPADYGHAMALLFNYHSSAAWTWAVCELESPPMVVYTDV
ncbi:hypothetical protein BBK36DRAFT_1139839 [Trichoderma citrinoviride]|uniref:Lanthionine synthetase C-like protein n=1 Tax=Trichoderma citrinoviride TaxID=58853 RepID=A0A2T4BG94_9HYPO|nr:hypothetical protein BBK36DRAFT_1139839 [Trichoderma citrinoviride]PTB68350.1 hypothetical protein BBK36DRAFT_1139839 [Trichoderma citrinoviride]